MRDEPSEKQEQLDLARAACAGDREAFGRLFKLLYPRVHRTVWGMMGNEADAHDVAQDAWIKAWKMRGRFNFQSAFSTWIHRIAVNTALDALRRNKRLGSRLSRLIGPDKEEVAIDPPDSPAGNPDSRLLQKETGKSIEAALAELPDDQRTVLVLREFEGYSYQEIAEVTGTRPGTVMSRLHHARQKIRAILSRELS